MYFIIYFHYYSQIFSQIYLVLQINNVNGLSEGINDSTLKDIVYCYLFNSYSSIIPVIDRVLLSDVSVTYVLTLSVNDGFTKKFKCYSFNDVVISNRSLNDVIDEIFSHYLFEYKSEIDDISVFSFSLKYKLGHSTLSSNSSHSINDNHTQLSENINDAIVKDILYNHFYLNKFIEDKYSNQGYSFNYSSNTLNSGYIKNTINLNDNFHFSFVDYISDDLTSFKRIFSNYTLKFNILSGYSISLKSFSKSFDNFPRISPSEVDNELLVTNYGIIDIETFNLNNNIIPYAIGIYYNSKFKYFYLSDFDTINYIEGNKMMINSLFEYLRLNKIKLLYAHNGGDFEFKLLLKYSDLKIKDESVENLSNKEKTFINRYFIRDSYIYFLY